MPPVWAVCTMSLVRAQWLTPQFQTITVWLEVFFYSANPYAIRLFATFILKIFLYFRLLIFVESAAAFNFPFSFEPHMCDLYCRNSTFLRICRAFDSGGGNECFPNCRILFRDNIEPFSYKECDVITERCQKLWYNEATKKKRRA